MALVIEVAGTRSALQHEVLDHTTIPHLLVRIGWQAIGRSQLPHPPRRPLDEVFGP